MTAELQTEDNIAGIPTYPIKLPAFEGPLDLLLFLVRKHEVDIYDIPIHHVTKQYLQIINDMQQLNLEVAGEFFVMAATLMQIKSSMLLPKDEMVFDPDADAEDTDPRWQLIQQLIEYKKFKDAAYTLEDLAIKQLDYIPRDYKEQTADKPKIPLKDSDRIEVWNVFNLVLRRILERIGSVGELHDEQITIADRMEYILDHTKTEKHFLFTKLFKDGDTFPFIVATFLAILELTRLKQITIKQHENFSDICIETIDDETTSKQEDSSEGEDSD